MNISPPPSPEPSEVISATSTAQSSRSSSPVQEKTADDIIAASCYVNMIPKELIHPIVEYISSMTDLINFMLVQRRWFNIGVRRLWNRPDLTSHRKLEMMVAVLVSNSLDSHQLANYSSLIRRLNFAHLNTTLKDGDLYAFLSCTQVKRLAIPGCSQLSPEYVSLTIRHMPRLQSVDLQNVSGINDDVIAALVENCPDLQLFYGGGDDVSNEGIGLLAKSRYTLKRLRLSGCPRATCEAIISLSKQCTQLIELDIGGMACFKDDISFTPPTQADNNLNPSTMAQRSAGFSEIDFKDVVTNCTDLREIRMDGSLALTPLINNFLDLSSVQLDSLRVLSLSRCSLLNDSAIAQIVKLAPNIRQLNISKCPLITDKTLKLVAETYNTALHYLHLGHCSKITDVGVSFIGKHCKRLTFFDANTCPNLTSRGMAALAKIPRLQRIGVVKCPRIDSVGVLALAVVPRIENRVSNIQRLHLSYCLSIGIEAIKALLDNCPRLVHISLTGVREFMRSEFLQLSRPAPSELTEHQRNLFCVFSGSGVTDLRLFLNAAYDSAEAWKFLVSPIPARSQSELFNVINQRHGVDQERDFRVRENALGQEAEQIDEQDELFQRIVDSQSYSSIDRRRLNVLVSPGSGESSIAASRNEMHMPLGYGVLGSVNPELNPSNNIGQRGAIRQNLASTIFNWIGPRPDPPSELEDPVRRFDQRSLGYQQNLLHYSQYPADQARQSGLLPQRLNPEWSWQVFQPSNVSVEYPQVGPSTFTNTQEQLPGLQHSSSLRRRRDIVGLPNSMVRRRSRVNSLDIPGDDSLHGHPLVAPESVTEATQNMRLDAEGNDRTWPFTNSVIDSS